MEEICVDNLEGMKGLSSKLNLLKYTQFYINYKEKKELIQKNVTNNCYINIAHRSLFYLTRYLETWHKIKHIQSVDALFLSKK